MEKFFINPIEQKLNPSFKIKDFNLGNGNHKPALVIDWSLNAQKVLKKTLLFENGDLLSEYIKELFRTHVFAYEKLVEFAKTNIKEKYPSIYNIITDNKTLIS